MPSIIARPTAGPSAIATAAAQFSSTTGDGVEPLECGVEGSDLGPVGVGWRGRLVVQDGDRGLELVRAGPAHLQGPCHQRLTFGDPRGVPARSVLVAEQDQLSGRPDACLPARIVQEQECQQRGRLGLIGEQRDHEPCQPDRLGTQLLADQRIAGRRGVSLVEHEVDDSQHAVEPFGQQLGRRHAIGDPGVTDLALGTDQSLGQRRLGDEERPGDLGSRQAAEGAQRQGHARLEGERRVTAGEDQAQPVIGDLHLVLRRARLQGPQLAFEGRLPDQGLGLLGQPPPASQSIDGAVPRRGRDPRARVGRDATLRPCLERADERVLDGLLGKVEVARHPDQRRDRPALLLAEQAIDGVMGGVRRSARGDVRPGTRDVVRLGQPVLGGSGRVGRLGRQFPAVTAAGSSAPVAAP